MNYLIDFIGVVLEVFIIYTFFGMLWESTNKVNKVFLYTFFCSAGAVLFISSIFLANTIILPILFVSAIFICSFLYISKLYIKLLFTLIIAALFGVSEICTGIALSYIVGASIEEIQKNNFSYLIAIILSKFILFVCLKISIANRKNKEYILPKVLVIALYLLFAL